MTVFKYRKLLNLWIKSSSETFFTVRGGNPHLHQQRAWDVLSNHRECKQLQLSCEWPMLSAQMFLKREHTTDSHLFLAVSTGAPGVAFLSRHLHSVGQSGCCHAPSGLQTALNLSVINRRMWYTASIWDNEAVLSLSRTPKSITVIMISFTARACYVETRQ